MKYQCSYCEADITENNVFQGSCPNCKKIIDFSTVKKIPSSEELKSKPLEPEDGKKEEKSAFSIDKPETLYCKYCGEKISSESKYCPSCGKELAAQDISEQLKKNFEFMGKPLNVWLKTRTGKVIAIMLTLFLIMGMRSCMLSYRQSAEEARAIAISRAAEEKKQKEIKQKTLEKIDEIILADRKEKINKLQVEENRQIFTHIGYNRTSAKTIEWNFEITFDFIPMAKELARSWCIGFSNDYKQTNWVTVKIKHNNVIVATAEYSPLTNKVKAE